MNKKTLLALSISSILSFSTASFAGNDHRSHDRDHAQDRLSHQVARIFHVVDVNQDGIISLDEFVAKKLAKAAPQFDRIDSDNNDLISLDELKAAVARHWDGEIDIAVLRQCIEDELQIDLPPFVTIEEKFAAADTNADGSIDFTEFSAAKTRVAEAKFGKIDANEDGMITPEEMAQALIKLYTFKMARRDCVEQQQDLSDVLGE